MFEDRRSKKVVFVSHCLLNQNSISDDTVDFPGTFKEVVELLLESQVGIVQMPCPELMCLGLDRRDPDGADRDVVIENTRIRRTLNEEFSEKKMDLLIDKVIYQIKEYEKYDFSILGIIGVNRSPSCGVETTSMNNKEVAGKGLFIENLKEKLNKKEIDVEMIGIKTSKVDKSLGKVRELLENE